MSSYSTGEVNETNFQSLAQYILERNGCELRRPLSDAWIARLSSLAMLYLATRHE